VFVRSSDILSFRRWSGVTSIEQVAGSVSVLLLCRNSRLLQQLRPATSSLTKRNSNCVE